MDSAHFHLLINHVPILLTIFSIPILAWGLIKRDKTATNLSLIGLILAGIFGIVAFQSGEGAEEIVEELAGVSERFIHDHEEIAETTYWISILLGLLAIGTYFIRKFKPALTRISLYTILLLSIIAGGFYSYTAYLGGQIRHTELRPDTDTTQPSTTVNPQEESEEGH